MFRLSLKQQADIFGMGLSTIIILGIIALVLGCLGALWLFVQIVSLLLSAIVEAAGVIASTYQGADPMVKFLILVAVGVAIYSVVKKNWRAAK